jgi:hypothetical protein
LADLQLSLFVVLANDLKAA